MTNSILDLKGISLITKLDQKTLFGGNTDPNHFYDCHGAYTRCNLKYPKNFDAFDHCMAREGCRE